MIDPNQPVKNPALKNAMADMRKNNTPETRNIVINQMMNAVFLAPAIVDFGKNAPKPDAQGKVKIEPNSKISFTLINTQDGKKFFMAFTDWEELRKWNKNPGQQTLMLRFDDYAALLEKNTNAAGFVINPYTENLRFDPATVASLKNQKADFIKAKMAAARAQAHAKAAHKIDPGSKVVLVEPTVYPDGMLDPICEYLQTRPDVQAAYIQVMIVNDTDKSYLMVLDCPQDDALFAAVAKAAHPYMAANKTMNMDITIAASPLGQQALKGTDPFYTKALGRIRDEDE
ncbi:MAG: enhanced serine sensitivity protein SseB C-terminal domain-containing protein [Gemmiger sp.]|nr:enhanced serine sensitivity protein SseB C-terminal domain-containing protein [Gemmiger sp.]